MNKVQSGFRKARLSAGLEPWRRAVNGSRRLPQKSRMNLMTIVVDNTRFAWDSGHTSQREQKLQQACNDITPGDFVVESKGHSCHSFDTNDISQMRQIDDTAVSLVYTSRSVLWKCACPTIATSRASVKSRHPPRVDVFAACTRS